MRVASWSTNEPQPDGWCLNLADQAVTCKVGGVVFSYGIEEGLRQYTSVIRADLATPAPREDGYSAGVRAAAEELNQACDAMWNDHDRVVDRADLGGFGLKEKHVRAISEAQQRLHTAILALLDAPALPDARAGAQCCMCGKKGLSTDEDGGPECQLDDDRWTCSMACWDRATGEADRPVSAMVKRLEWGEAQKPNDFCRYDHCASTDPAWQYRFEWKSWKDYDSRDLYRGASDEYVGSYSTNEEAKAAAQADHEARIIAALHPTPACTATDGPASACVYRAPGLGTAADWERG